MKKTSPPSTKPIVTVDYEKYLHHLSDTEASDEEKIAYIKMLAEILVSFVDLGFGVHPAQQAQGSCGKDKEKPLKSAAMAPDALYLHHQHLSENFEDAADLELSRHAERIQS